MCVRVGCVYVFICISAVCVRFSSYHPSDSDKCVRSTWRSPVALRYPERAATHLGLKMPEFLRSATCNSESWGCQNILPEHHYASSMFPFLLPCQLYSRPLLRALLLRETSRGPCQAADESQSDTVLAKKTTREPWLGPMFLECFLPKWKLRNYMN